MSVKDFVRLFSKYVRMLWLGKFNQENDVKITQTQTILNHKNTFATLSMKSFSILRHSICNDLMPQHALKHVT